MILKSARTYRWPSAHKASIKTRAGLARKIADQTNYISEDGKNDEGIVLTSCTSNKPEVIARELAAWAELNTKITDPTRHIVMSPEPGDRMLERADFERMIEIYREERGLGDAPYFAKVHSDGHANRHPQHLHFYFIRIKSDGKAVPDSWDAAVHRRVSRRIEKELGLKVNPGADPKYDAQKTDKPTDAEAAHMFNGRDRQNNRDTAAQVRSETNWRVDPAKVQAAIDRSTNQRELRENLREMGIECRMRRRDGGVYAWALRNEGSKEWTSGSKLVNGNVFGWKQVQTQLDANKANKPKPEFTVKAQQNSKNWPAPRSAPIRAPRRKRKEPNAGEIEQQIDQIETQAQQAFTSIVNLLKGLTEGGIGVSTGTASSGGTAAPDTEKATAQQKKATNKSGHRAPKRPPQPARRPTQTPSTPRQKM